MNTTRAQMIAVASDLLEEGGPAAVTLREVGRRTGLSHNAPYKHFIDKQDLLGAVAADGLRRFSATPPNSDRHMSALSGLRTLLTRYLEEARARPRLFTLTYGAWDASSMELDAAANDAHQVLIDAVRAAQADHSLPSGDPERLASLFLVTTYGAAHLELSGHLAPDGKGHADPEGLVDDLLLYLAGPRHP